MAYHQSLGFVFADGEKLAVGNLCYDRMYLLDTYHVKDLTLHQDYVDLYRYGGSDFIQPIATGQRIEFTVSSYGKFSSVPYDEGLKLFTNPKDMSINDLLALAFQKMDARQG